MQKFNIVISFVHLFIFTIVNISVNYPNNAFIWSWKYALQSSPFLIWSVHSWQIFGSISLLSIYGLTGASSRWIIRRGMAWTGLEMWIYFCNICLCMVEHLAKLSKGYVNIIYVSQPCPNIAPWPLFFKWIARW